MKKDLIYAENFHTHLEYCNHAVGHAIDYIEQAEKAGFTTLGFSDHTPFPKGDPHPYRMRLEQMPLYREEILSAAKDRSLKVYLGLEMDIEERLDTFYNELTTKYQFDYLIGSIHSFDYKQDRFYVTDLDSDRLLSHYFELLMYGLSSRRFNFIGHPDRFFYSIYAQEHLKDYEKSWSLFLEEAKKQQIPIEFNTSNNYHFFYADESPLLNFWRAAAEVGVDVIVSSDAHAPEHVARFFKEAYTLLDKLQVNVTAFSKNLD